MINGIEVTIGKPSGRCSRAVGIVIVQQYERCTLMAILAQLSGVDLEFPQSRIAGGIRHEHNLVGMPDRAFGPLSVGTVGLVDDKTMARLHLAQPLQ